MAIQPHYRTIQQLLQSRSFSIDEYQREYKWDKRNIDELLSDLVGRFQSAYTAGDTPKAVSGYPEYFLGSIIVTQREGKNYLVDGQQRTTSLTLLLIFLYREARARSLKVTSTIEPLIYSNNLGELEFNLDIPERIPVLRALFEGDAYTVDGKDESIATIVSRFDDIEAMDFDDDLGEGFEPFIYWLLTRVGLIEIVADSDAQAYGIFETMNDRGKPLSPVDMLKAYLLAPVDDADARARANDIWRRTTLSVVRWGEEPDAERDAAAMKAWLRAQYAESVRERKARSVDKDWEQIGTTFHRWIRDNEPRVGTGSAARNLHVLTDEVPFFTRAYLQILDATARYTPGLEHVFYNAHNEFTWQPTVLLAPLDPKDDQATVTAKIAATAAYLDIWIMRRAANYIRVAYSSVSYAMYLLVKDIRRLPLDVLVETLQRRLDEDDVTFDGAESRGRRGVEDLGLNMFSRRYIFHLLARLTALVERESGGPDLFAQYVDRNRKNSSDIEHIWANRYERYADTFASRSDFAEVRNNIGGLIMLPADVNRSFQDKTFEEKSSHYAKQNLLAASLTKAAYEHQPQFAAFRARTGLDFRPYESFGPEEQAERRLLMLNLAKLEWSPDRIREAAANG